MYLCQEGKCFKFNVEGLGEFTFIFTPNTKTPIPHGEDKYYVECHWNPEYYGLIDFIVGYYVECVDKEVKKLRCGLDYYIDCARISCECHLTDDIDGEVYLDILKNYFNYDEDGINKTLKTDMMIG